MQCSDYMATNPSTVIHSYASGMLLNIFLGIMLTGSKPATLNGNIHVISTVINLVASSVAEEDNFKHSAKKKYLIDSQRNRLFTITHT